VECAVSALDVLVQLYKKMQDDSMVLELTSEALTRMDGKLKRLVVDPIFDTLNTIATEAAVARLASLSSVMADVEDLL
jgi:hypothetical protein